MSSESNETTNETTNETSRRPWVHHGGRRPAGISPTASSRSAAVNPPPTREVATPEAAPPVEAPPPVEAAPAPENGADPAPRPSGPRIGHRVRGVPVLPRAVAPRSVPDEAKPSHPSLYFNAELSWLDFNWRVLYQAMDERTPLLLPVFIVRCPRRIE